MAWGAQVTPEDKARAERAIKLAASLWPNSLVQLTYYGQGDSPEGETLQIEKVGSAPGGLKYVQDIPEEFLEALNGIMWCGGADYNNDGGGGEIEIDTSKLTMVRREYNNHYERKWEEDTNYQAW